MGIILGLFVNGKPLWDLHHQLAGGEAQLPSCRREESNRSLPSVPVWHRISPCQMRSSRRWRAPSMAEWITAAIPASGSRQVHSAAVAGYIARDIAAEGG